MWQFSGAPADHEDDRVIEKHVAEALNSAVKSLIQVIWTDDEDARHDAEQRMVLITKARTRWSTSESKLPNAKPLISIF